MQLFIRTFGSPKRHMFAFFRLFVAFAVCQLPPRNLISALGFPTRAMLLLRFWTTRLLCAALLARVFSTLGMSTFAALLDAALFEGRGDVTAKPTNQRCHFCATRCTTQPALATHVLLAVVFFFSRLRLDFNSVYRATQA